MSWERSKGVWNVKERAVMPKRDKQRQRETYSAKEKHGASEKKHGAS